VFKAGAPSDCDYTFEMKVGRERFTSDFFTLFRPADADSNGGENAILIRIVFP